VTEIHRFDKEANVIIMDDCGEGAMDLKELMRTNPPSVALASEMGACIGEFLSRLHTWGRGNEELLRFFDANQQARRIYGWATYGRLVSTLSGQDGLPKLLDPPLEVSAHDMEIVSKLADERIAEINTSMETMTMGDFWTGNLLINIVDEKLEKITVVDWELAKPAPAALDVGQLYAELELLRVGAPDDSAAQTLTCFDSTSTHHVELP
jgi:5-methylthioribose kinase